MFSSTLAFVASKGGFEHRDGVWRHTSGAAFDPTERQFESTAEAAVQPFPGFDTFWFNWSMTHPTAEIVPEP